MMITEEAGFAGSSNTTIRDWPSLVDAPVLSLTAMSTSPDEAVSIVLLTIEVTSAKWFANLVPLVTVARWENVTADPFKVTPGAVVEEEVTALVRYAAITVEFAGLLT
jgi:hypothetical protein